MTSFLRKNYNLIFKIMENLEEYLEVHFDIVEFITEHLTAYTGDDN